MIITEKQKALVLIWQYALDGLRDYIKKNNYVFINGQNLIGSVVLACENVNTLFPIDFYGKQAFLTQSNQLTLEPWTQHFGKVYTEIQSFRQEPNADNRRLAQFTLAELEILGNLDDLIFEIENCIRSMGNSVAENCEKELSLFNRKPKQIHNLQFDRITYTEAVDILQNYFKDLKWGDDLNAEHEAKLTQLLKNVAVTRYPADIKFWNMKNDPEDEKCVLSCDMLLTRSGESVGAAERCVEPDRLIKKLETSEMFKLLTSQGVKRESFDWYIKHHFENDIKGHSGCGLGINRIMWSLLDTESILEATPFIVNKENLI